MPRVIDIRDNDSTELQEILVSNELRLIGFHKRDYKACEIAHEDGDEVSVFFDEIDDLISALEMVKQIREGMQT